MYGSDFQSAFLSDQAATLLKSTFARAKDHRDR